MKCISPITARHSSGFSTFPCGRCAACLQRYTNDFFVRANIEYSRSNFVAQFVTLTYNSNFVPDFVSKSDIQAFFKRLRINLKRYSDFYSFKYLIVSEYGPLHNRPRYRDWET